MRIISRMTPKLVALGVLVGGVLVAWVSRSTLAQDPPKLVALIEPPATTTATIAKPEASQEVLQVPALSETPQPDRQPLPAQEALLPLPPPGIAIARNETDDPEKSVKAFVEQNQKVAEAQLKNLKDESDRLRSRLQKVDAGIKRWEAVLEALKQSQAISSVADLPGANLSPVPRPRALEPVDTKPEAPKTEVQGHAIPSPSPSPEPPPAIDGADAVPNHSKPSDKPK